MPSRDRAITALTATGHALVHTYELSIPIFLTVWAGTFDATSGELGLAVTAGYALFGLGAVPGGVLADRFGALRRGRRARSRQSRPEWARPFYC